MGLSGSQSECQNESVLLLTCGIAERDVTLYPQGRFEPGARERVQRGFEQGETDDVWKQ